MLADTTAYEGSKHIQEPVPNRDRRDRRITKKDPQAWLPLTSLSRLPRRLVPKLNLGT